jgi:hypothetical protein
MVLLRASVWWAGGAPWGDAARRLGVHRHTVARAALAAGIAPLPVSGGAHADAAHSAIRRMVLSNVARPLLRGKALRTAESHAVAGG